ncbi:DUF1616 domain-containing protein [Haloarcula ordinaria]|uniref:DUF1616 domain-containing protein n=2 Tax=Haloarcula TaxID=2237 RepID=UPI0023E84408|nr:DUF1616 domain-containing protein [Halomicroarcula sp. ZS-22-S1]
MALMAVDGKWTRVGPLRPPSDLVVLALFVVTTGVVIFVPPLNSTLLRPALTLVFVLFVPGYVVVSALFPRERLTKGDQEKIDSYLIGSRKSSLGRLERFVLSFGASVSLVILVGLVLGLTPGRLNRVTLFVVLAAFTFLGSLVVMWQRLRVPSDERFRLSFGPVIEAVHSGVFEHRSTVEAVVNVALVSAVLLAVITVGVGLGQQEEAGITEFYLLSENEDGEFVASEYPSALTRGERHSFAVAINNQEGEQREYTTVVLLQRLQTGDGSAEVTARTELHRFETTVEDNETRQIEHSVTPKVTGENYRVVYLLYADEPPERPTAENSYRNLHLWVEIESDR